MSWAYRVARVSDIDIKIHITFVIIPILVGLEWGQQHGVTGFGFGVLIALALFACVTLHELGHSLVAQRFKIPVREIVLLPIGGLALLAKLPSNPRHELAIAAAGPAVNVLIAGVLILAIGSLGPGLAPLDGHGLVAGSIPDPSLATFLVWLLAANVTLVLFNLIPAFPLDGGRMLRAVLAMLTDYRRATSIAATIGQAAAVLLGILGVWSGNFILAIIAVFIFFGAGRERALTRAKTVLTTRRVGDAYNKHALTLTPGDRLSTVVDYLLTSYQPDFAVVLGGRLLGVVTREDVMRALTHRDDDPYVAEIMQRDVVQVGTEVGLDDAQESMSEHDVRLLAVFSGERYLGLVSREDLGEALSVLLFESRRLAHNRTAGAGR